jgi:serine/threonine protein phosphatase PrpC
MLKVVFGAATNPGRVRELNEDSALASGGIAVVADGMGGHAAGEVASQLAVGRLEKLVARSTDLTTDDLLSAIGDANQEILDAAIADAQQSGMGTTIAGIAVVTVGGSDHWMVFNVGDSRVYRLSGGALFQVSVDHSEVEELLVAGRLTREEARVYPRRNVVTRSLGTDPAPQADMWVFPPTPGERFLVCSDGLPLEVDDETIEQVLCAQSDAQAAADVLVGIAVDAGGRDNVTVVVVDVESPGGGSSVNGDTAPRIHPAEEHR